LRSSVTAGTDSGKAGCENRLPSNIGGLLADLDDAARDHVFHQGRVDPRPPDQRLQHMRIEIDRVAGGKRAGRARASKRRANEIDDDSAAHRSGPISPEGQVHRR